MAWKEKDKEKAYYAAYRAANKERIKEWGAAYRESDPEYQRERSAIYRAANRGRGSAWYAANKEKYKGYAATQKAKNPNRMAERYADPQGKMRASIAAWRARNPETVKNYYRNRRARKKGNGGKLSKDISCKLYILQHGKCAVCKTSLKKTGQHLDHILPLILGGKNDDSNIQLTCPTCNLKKGGKHPIIFMQSMGFLL